MVCGTTPCMLRGAGELIEVCQHKIDHEPFEVSADGTLSWEEVECLGACVNAPMVMIGNDTYEDLTVERFEEIVDAFRAGNGQDDQAGHADRPRQFSAAEGGATTLLERRLPSAPTSRSRRRRRRRLPAAPRGCTPAPAAARASCAGTCPHGSADDADQCRPRQPESSKRDAPALKGPPTAPRSPRPRPKASAAKANAAPTPTASPTAAMREDATGAESPAGKIDGGKAPRKTARQEAVRRA